MAKLRPGRVLVTRNGFRVGNAIIVQIAYNQCLNQRMYSIKTDYGNNLTLLYTELIRLFHIMRKNINKGRPPHKHAPYTLRAGWPEHCADLVLAETFPTPDAKEGQASGWIRASERRPRLGQRVLVCSGDGIVQDETFTYNRDDSNFDFWDRDEIDGILVSEDDLWMPKPAAPAPEAQKGKE